MKTICAGLAAYVLVAIQCSAQSVMDDVQWRDRFLFADFPEVVEMLREDRNAWPSIASQEIMLSRDQSREWRILPIMVLQKMQDYDRSPGRDMREAVTTYAAALSEFRARGGYANYVLATSAEALAVSRLSAHIIAHPADYDLVKDLLRKLPRYSITDPALVDIFREELGLENRSLKQGVVSVGDLAQMLGLDDREFASRGRYDLLSSRKLLDEQNLAGLLWRRMMLTMVINVQLSGYLAFLEKGGEFSVSMMSDTTEWNNIMGTTAEQYGLPELGVRAVGPMFIYGWMEEFHGGHENTPFYALVFE